MLRRAADHIRSHLSPERNSRSAVGIVLGSGLGAAASSLVAQQLAAIDYADVPGMPESGVAGHRGRLLIGQHDDLTIYVLQGRIHSYEGYDPSALTFGVRLLCTLGLQYLILTNAAGGIRDGLLPGHLMLIQDHLEFPRSLGLFAPESTAVGSNCPWDEHLLNLADSTATELTTHRGTYAMMPGPNYETPSEIRALATIGADAVGMSTVPEARCASAAGVKVLGVSCITNLASGISQQPLNHGEVSQTAGRIETEFAEWLNQVVRRIHCEQ